MYSVTPAASPHPSVPPCTSTFPGRRTRRPGLRRDGSLPHDLHDRGGRIEQADPTAPDLRGAAAESAYLFLIGRGLLGGRGAPDREQPSAHRGEREAPSGETAEGSDSAGRDDVGGPGQLRDRLLGPGT